MHVCTCVYVYVCVYIGLRRSQWELLAAPVQKTARPFRAGSREPRPAPRPIGTDDRDCIDLGAAPRLTSGLANGYRRFFDTWHLLKDTTADLCTPVGAWASVAAPGSLTANRHGAFGLVRSRHRSGPGDLSRRAGLSRPSTRSRS